MDVTRSCTLAHYRGEGMHVAVNGRSGRRVVCVLDGARGLLDVFDFAAEEEEEEIVEGEDGAGESPNIADPTVRREAADAESLM